MTTGSIFWVVVSAISGGAFVLAGVLMERFSEKDWHKNLSDFRRCKSRNIYGEWLVIIGIGIEMVVGIFSAVNAWKNNPQNASISEISAIVDFKVKENKRHETPNLGTPEVARM